MTYTFPYKPIRNICVFGGHIAWKKDIKQYFKNLIIINDEDKKSNYENIIINSDIIWIEHQAISHSLFNKVLKIARKHNKEVHYFNKKGAKTCAKIIIDFERKQNI